MSLTLLDYRTKVRRLLRDQTASLYSNDELNAYIAESRHRRDLDTRRVKACFGLSLTANVSTYSLLDVGAAPLVRGEATCLPKDVVSLHVIPTGGTAGGSGLRYPLARVPYSRLAYLVSTSWPGYPYAYAVYDPNTIVLAPPPPLAYAAEWDTVGIFPDLVQDTDVEPMPDPYNDPLPYLAASIAKVNAQRYDEADRFLADYETSLMKVVQGIRQLAIAAPWADLPRGMR